jgi:uncharacterized protein YndB with AHSA1/START domain
MSTQTAIKPSLTLKRRLKAPPEKVFAAWIDPEKVMRWMGPGDGNAVSVECDARVGGRYRWVMRAPDGEEHDVSGVYREVVPSEKLVFTWAWKSTPERESLVTVLLKPDGDGRCSRSLTSNSSTKMLATAISKAGLARSTRWRNFCPEFAALTSSPATIPLTF